MLVAAYAAGGQTAFIVSRAVKNRRADTAGYQSQVGSSAMADLSLREMKRPSELFF